jgi:hypothetical protein
MNARLRILVTAIAVITATIALWADHQPPGASVLERAIEAHAAQTMRDTARISTAVAVAESARISQEAAVRRRRALDARAMQFDARADSAHAAEIRAVSLADSIASLGVAYVMRTEEATTLRAEVATADTALSWAVVRSDSLGSALSLSESRAQRADSLLAIVGDGSGATSGCRMMKFIPCPSRRVLGWLLIALALREARR